MELGQIAKYVTIVPEAFVYDDGRMLDGRDVVHRYGLERLMESCRQIETEQLRRDSSEVSAMDVEHNLVGLDEIELIEMYDAHIGHMCWIAFGQEEIQSDDYATILYWSDDGPQIAAQAYCMIQNGVDEKSGIYALKQSYDDGYEDWEADSWDWDTVAVDIDSLRYYRHAFENLDYEDVMWMDSVVPKYRRRLIDDYLRDYEFDRDVISILATADDKDIVGRMIEDVVKDKKGVMKDMGRETKNREDVDDVMTNQWVDDVLRAKRSGSYFVSFTNGKHQIDAMAAPYFRGANTEGSREQANGVLVFEDGRLIYGVGSDLVDNEYQTYTQGDFRSDDALRTYLVEKYRGEDFRYTENVVEDVLSDVPKVYDNREYQAKLEREQLLAELDTQKLGKSVKNLSSAPGVNVYDEKGHVMDGREILEKHGIEFLRECCSQIDKSYLENIISDINPAANNRADYMDDRNLVRRYDVNLGAQYLSDMGDTYESVRHANGLYMNFVGKDVNPEDVCAVAAQVYCMVENGADSKSIDYLWDKGVVDNLDVNAMRWYRHSFENVGYDNTLWMEDVVPENRRELVDSYIRDCAFDEQVVRSISAMSFDYVARKNVDRFRESFEKKTDWVNQIREMKFADFDFASYSNGEHQIDAMSSPFIVDGDDRKSGIAVYEDGRPLYVTGSELIDGHYEPYTIGEFHTEEGMAAYLMEKYRGKDFEKIGSSSNVQLAHVDMLADKVYQNPERQSAYEAEMKNLEMSGVSNDKEDMSVDLVEDVPEAAVSESKLPKWIQSVLDARGMECVDVAFSNGEHQIDASGYAVESGYEFFTGGLSIYEDGKPLFVMDSDCVDNYHFESYTLGQFHSIEDVTAYLVKKYGDQSFEPVAEQKTAVLGDYKKVYDNPSYQKKYEAQLRGTEEDLLDRVVFKSQGRVKGRNGVMYNRVDFAYACDNKRWGIDEPMANPYLNTSKQKMPDGKLVTNHSYYLSDAIYNCLTSHANSAGMENSKWDGVIAAKVMYPTDRNGKQKLSVDLTRDAVSRGDVMTPKVPFDELKHDKFVKLSMAEVHKKREEMAARQLPEVGEAQTGAEMSCGK